MKITFSTFKSDRLDKERLYTISFKPEETLHIIDSPAGLFITELQTHTQFHILPIDGIPEKDQLIFAYSDECYTFYSQRGFKTHDEHLDWLISLGKIPMIYLETPRKSTKGLILGYVEFTKEA